jgi:hypothetical protein
MALPFRKNWPFAWGQSAIYRAAPGISEAAMDQSFKPTQKTRIRRLPKRAHYDKASVHAVLDAGVLCHVG